MEFMDLAAARYSVRSFRPEPVAQTDIDTILKAAQLAPTGCNNQPQKIFVIRSAEGMAALRGCTKCHFGAPMAFLVCADTTRCWTRPYDGKSSADIDASIVATHMLLAAHDAGVGTCWVMYFDPAALRDALGLAPELEPVALLVAGYPAGDAAPLPLHFETRAVADFVEYL